MKQKKSPPVKKIKTKSTTVKKPSGRNKIFIQIASYRDPELVPTIKDCINRASKPENLVFSICNQFHPDDEFNKDLEPYRDDPRFKIIDIDYDKSEGTCWARYLLQQQYINEQYTLQLDSHHRFVDGWDDICKTMISDLKKAGHKKPLLTAYLPSYDPDNDPNARVQEPWWMTFDRFIPEGAVFFLPATMPDWQDRELPMPSRFYSAHFCFTIGKFVKEVPHDPQYYFHGEEISIAVRAYTHGYDLFHPHKIVCWHEYTRKGRAKHWDDVNAWVPKNKVCHDRNRKLFGMDGAERDQDYTDFDFGKTRSVEEYEAYSGLRFKDRAVQQYTLDNNEAPNPKGKTKKEQQELFIPWFKHCIDLGFDSVPEDDYEFWVVAFEDKDGETIYREDADEHEIERMKNDPDGYIKVWRQFRTEARPVKWVIWPFSKSKEWCERMEGNIPWET